jgi:hypothetical protein
MRQSVQEHPAKAEHFRADGIIANDTHNLNTNDTKIVVIDDPVEKRLCCKDFTQDPKSHRESMGGSS